MRAALVTLIAEQSFASITVAALAERAGVGYATFFRHYPDKHSLLAEVADATIADLLARLVPILAAGDGPAAMRALVAEVDRQRALCRALLIGAGDAIRRTVTDLAVARSLSTPGDIPTWVPRDLGVTHMVGAALTILTWWLDQDAPLPPDRIADILYRLVIAPVATPG